MSSGVPRIASIDVLRGVAVLGILLMNIQSFSMVTSAYTNPTAYGEFSGLNAVTWAFTRLFADQKFMTLFSMLFGAGIVLMSERSRARGCRPWAAHLRRMIVLLIIGIAHACLLWYGDILAFYALCGMLVYWMRKWRPAILFGLGATVVVLASTSLLYAHNSFPSLPEEERSEWEQAWRPDEETVAWELEVYRGKYWQQMEHRIGQSYGVYDYLILAGLGRVCGLMWIGMALFKWKILGAYRSRNFYQRLMFTGLAAGVVIEGAGMYYQVQKDWSLEAMMPGYLFNYYGSLFIAAGYLGVVMLIHQLGKWRGAQKKIAAVGRMAFTNYVAQTVICTTIFYGHGFGLFGHVERWQQLILVVAVWGLQIAWSNLWLSRFDNGPLEWLWRCATYLKVVRFKKDEEDLATLPPVLST